MNKDVTLSFRAPADVRNQIDDYLTRNRKRRLHGRKITMGVFILDCIRERFEKYGRAKKCNTKRIPRQSEPIDAAVPDLVVTGEEVPQPDTPQIVKSQADVDDDGLFRMLN